MRGRAAGRRYENALLARGFRLVAGVDEVGRGSLAGPVVAAAVILDGGHPVPGLRDSKLLTASRRDTLARQIAGSAVAVGIGEADVREIESLNILRATLLAMRRAVEALAVAPDFVLVDALTIPGIDVPQRGIIHGDRLSSSVAAASIVAKVHRDTLMGLCHQRWPDYRFDANKGYGTADHLAALRRCGASPLHRTTFRGVTPGPQLPLFPAAAPRSR
jgi:ribonuclease HII